MKKSILAGVMLATVAFSSGALARSLFGAKGEFSTFLSDLKYDPTRACSKPYKPYAADRYTRDAYATDAERYVDCLKTAQTLTSNMLRALSSTATKRLCRISLARFGAATEAYRQTISRPVTSPGIGDDGL